MTGADGFLGWHLRCALHASGERDVSAITRTDWENSARLDQILGGVDVVFHCAGVNRPVRQEDMDFNVTLGKQLTAALDRAASAPVVIYANSIQAGSATPFGQTKLLAAEHLRTWAENSGAILADVRLPNLFGEGGRPNYNSVVATFSFLLATGGTPRIIEDRRVSLLHVQDAADILMGLVRKRSAGTFEPEGRPLLVSEILEKLQGFSDLYREHEIPDVRDRFDRALFNTYRWYCFPQMFPIQASPHADNRGTLFECVRGHGGQSQVFCSTTVPGATRGNHFHRRKIERFIVIGGNGTIALRRLFHEPVVRFKLAGQNPSMVDMPTLWTHSIVNDGSEDLVTLFWADEIPETGSSDTYPEPVALAAARP